jgi:hypothetical protein
MGEGTWFQPASGLSAYPTLPIDGQPQSVPTPSVETLFNVPGEHREIHSAPSTYLFSPEYAVGQGNFAWAYDPAEYGATKTPLGHDYQEPAKQGQIGKNAWTSWYKLVPTKLMSGWVRLHGTQATLGDVRLGMLQLHLTMKGDVPLDADRGWEFLRVGALPQLYADGALVPATNGVFARGAVAVFTTPGGTAVLCGDGTGLTYRVEKNAFTLAYRPDGSVLAKDKPFEIAVPFLGISNRLKPDEVLRTLADFGVLRPGTTRYAPAVGRGRTLSNYAFWRAEAKDGAFECRVPKVALAALVPVQVEGLNDRWTAFLLDRQRPAPNFRPIPVRDRCGYALLDPTEADADFFVGHPLTCDNPKVRLQVSWKEPGRWFVEAHNDGDAAAKTTIAADRSWPLFAFRRDVTLAPGSSQVWEVEGK